MALGLLAAALLAHLAEAVAVGVDEAREHLGRALARVRPVGADARVTGALGHAAASVSRLASAEI